MKKCDQCQRFAPNIHQLGGVLNPLSNPWPFAQWGLDIVGSFPKAVGNKRYLLVGTNYFTKWVEAEPLAYLFGKISSPSLESHIHSSQTMDFSLIVKPSEDTVTIWI